MYSKFLGLKPEKQERILNAAIKEFADKGYANASTNEIVKVAEISKGLLFHYFQNKKQLFLFIFDYCIDLLMEEFYPKIDLTERDFFVRLRQVVLAKIELLNKHPEIFKFFSTAYMDNASEVSVELDKRRKELTENNFDKIFGNIDLSLFKEDLDVQRVIKIVLWSSEGLSNEALERAKHSPTRLVEYDKVFQDVQVYIDIFRQSFYK